MIRGALRQVGKYVVVERPHSIEDVREAVAGGLFNVVAFVTRDVVVNVHVTVLSVGFRITLSRAYSFIGVGAFGFVAGALAVGGMREATSAHI